MQNTKQKENIIIFICWLAYTVAYIGRLNYTASIVSIISTMGITKAQAGLVSSFFFFAYGVGQLVNGVLSKKYNSRIAVFSALMISAAINVAMPLCNNIALMKIVWFLNGCVQSILWSTLVKTISEYVSDEKLAGAIFVMSTPNTVGTFLVYGIAALNVRFFSWKLSFYVATVLLVITAVAWYILFGCTKNLTKKTDDTIKQPLNKLPVGIIVSMAFMALAGIANGFVKDGINTWVPSVLYEEFGVSQSLSIFLTLLLPLVATFGAGITKEIHKKIESHATLDLIFYGVSAVLTACIFIVLDIHNIVLLMLIFVCLACLMAMINNVITSMYPLDSRTFIASGFAAGLLNTFCYVGSTLTSYTLGSVAQTKGWNSVFLIMLLVCIVGGVSSLIGAKSLKKLGNAD